MIIRLFNRFFDLLIDRRMPWLLGLSLAMRPNLRKIKLAPEEEVLFALTVDTEQDYGSSDKRKSFSALPGFCKNFLTWSRKEKILTTLFVQAEAAQSVGAELKAFEKAGHEIGVHGLKHELWARPRWFTREISLPARKRFKALQECLDLFKKAGLKKPEPFRAPNMAIDSSTYSALKKAGFKGDSSPSVFRGCGLKPDTKKGVKIVPVSADPCVRLRFVKGVPVGEHLVFNMYQLTALPEKELLEMLDRVLKFQKKNNGPLHLVFLTHSWEMETFEDAYKHLSRLLTALRKRYNLKPVTFNSLV